MDIVIANLTIFNVEPEDTVAVLKKHFDDNGKPFFEQVCVGNAEELQELYEDFPFEYIPELHEKCDLCIRVRNPGVMLPFELNVHYNCEVGAQVHVIRAPDHIYLAPTGIGYFDEEPVKLNVEPFNPLGNSFLWDDDEDRWDMI